MQVIVSARQFEPHDGLRRLVEERLQRLERFEPRVSRAEVTLLEEKNHCEAEALLSVDRSTPIHARARARDFRTATDRLVDKLSRQLRKHHSRRRDHQAVPRDARPSPEE